MLSENHRIFCNITCWKSRKKFAVAISVRHSFVSSSHKRRSQTAAQSNASLSHGVFRENAARVNDIAFVEIFNPTARLF